MDRAATRQATEPVQDPVPEYLRAVGLRPGAALYLTEPARGMFDAAMLPLGAPWLARAPRGDGHGVLVLPGLLAADGSTRPLRMFLRRKGHYVRGWRLGRNYGPTESVLDGMPGGLRDLAERTEGPVSIIGWSLGGIYARHLARQHPGLVRQVITLGSPFGVAHGHRTRADATFERLGSLHARGGRVPPRRDLSAAVNVPSTSLYSKLDGVVGWRSCLGPTTPSHQNVEVRCSHLGFGFDPATMWVVADRLARPVTDWAPFEAPRLLRPLYPRT